MDTLKFSEEIETEVLLQKIERFPDATSKRFSAKDEAALCRAFLFSSGLNSITCSVIIKILSDIFAE